MKFHSKITNKNKIEIQFRLIGLLILCDFLVLFFLFFLQKNLSFKEEAGIASGILFIVLLVLFYRMRYFEFDSSGEVISIRSYHPVFRTLERRTEFPKQKLRDYKIENNGGAAVMKIYLQMLERKNVAIKYSIHGLGRNKIQKLQNSLQKTKESYIN